MSNRGEGTEAQGSSAMIPVITYTLRDDQEQSDQYYSDVGVFADQVIAEGEHRAASILESFESFLRETGRETARTRPEYLYEFLTLGVLWRVYAGNALGLAPAPRRVLTGLARVRERYRRLKPGVDVLSGILAGWFLSSQRRAVTDAPRALGTLDRLLAWLEATGNFGEEVKRLGNWRDFFAAQSSEQTADHLATAIEFADWFAARSIENLGRYTPNVEQFLRETHPHYRGREDALFCGRQRVEYHVNMIGTEILNRAFRASFLLTHRKIVVVPPCMRFQPDGKCEARSVAFGAQCAHCTANCRIHQLTCLGDKCGFGVFILPDELQVFSKGTLVGGGAELGIVGVSCALTNAPGGWETRSLGVPAQGLLLDYCGCRYHWHKEGIPTDINFSQLLRVLDIHPSV